MKTPKTSTTDPGLAEIGRWRAWFIRAHEQRLQSAAEFPDRHLVDQERAQIAALAAAVADRMREQYLARIPK